MSARLILVYDPRGNQVFFPWKTPEQYAELCAKYQKVFG